MNITVYCYDHTGNPRCGGGGAYRTQIIHSLLSKKHSISMFFGFYQGAKPYTTGNAHVRFLGCGRSYLMSRITFAIFATIHSLVNKSDLTIIEYSVFSPVFSFLFKPNATVMQIHHLIGKEPLRKYAFFGLLPMFAEYLFLRFSRYIVTSADSVATHIHNTYPYITTKATYNGIEEAIYSSSKTDHNFILTLGRLDVYMKGLDILLDAFDSIAGTFPDHTLIIAGRGNEKDITWLKNRIHQSPYSTRINLQINISAEQKTTLLHTATFGCMPSRFEGWNIVAIETAASSKATLGTSIMGLKDTIKADETGLLVPPDDSKALAQAMTRLLSDSTLRESLGKKGYQWAKTFSWDKIAANQEQFYYDVLNNTAGKNN